MLGEHHAFETEFPEYEQAIRELKQSNLEFARLLKEHDETDDEIYRIEEQIETPSDEYTEELKMKRVQLKDKLYAIVQAWVSDH